MRGKNHRERGELFHYEGSDVLQDRSHSFSLSQRPLVIKLMMTDHHCFSLLVKALVSLLLNRDEFLSQSV